MLENAKEYIGRIKESMRHFFSGNGVDDTYPTPKELKESRDIKEYIERFSKNRYGMVSESPSNNGFSKRSIISICELYGSDYKSVEKEIIGIFSAISKYEDAKNSRWNVDYAMGEYIERCSLSLELEEPMEDGTEEIELRYSQS